MTELSSIVSVSVEADSRSVARQGFGIPLVLSYHARWSDRYRVYSSAAEMLAASEGFTTYDDTYRMCAAIFDQDPTVEEVVVGRIREAPAWTQTLTLTATYAAGQKVSFTYLVPGTGAAVDYSYTILGSEGSINAVATAVEAEIEALTGLNSSVATNVITVTSSVSGARPHFYNLVGCTIEETTAEPSSGNEYDTELAALVLENNDWFFVLTDTSSPANVAAVAAWCLTNDKMYLVSTNSAAELTSGGTLATNLASNENVAILFSKRSHDFTAARWLGACAPQDAGSITWAFKALAGGTPDSLTTTQKGFLDTHNANHYQTVAGLPVVRQGVTTSGEYVDIVHGIFALKADIAESVYGVLASLPKTPFTQKGFDAIENAIMGALRRFEGTQDAPKLLTPGTARVIMPNLATARTNGGATRRLTGVRFSADLAGAIHFVSVVGVVSAS
jgi:Protein of unknown function (DUF3383)